MSTLKTHNLQSPDAGSVNIAMTPNAGMIVAGLSTYSNQINVGSNIKLGTAGIVTATTFVGNLTGNPTGSGANLTNLPPSAPVGGASTNTVFFENDKLVEVGYQITSTKNAMSAGPISISAGIAVTVPSGCSWTIV